MSGTYKILAVEDEAAIRENIVKKLGEAHPGFEVAAQAHNGAAALEILKGRAIDLLVTDIRMAVMDGLELVESVYYNYPEMKMIIVSGYNDFEYARRAMPFGVSAFLLKPVDGAELKNALSRVYDRLRDDDSGPWAEQPSLPEKEARVQLAESAAEYYRANYAKHPVLEQVAERLHVSPTYLGRAFKDHFGVSPSKYLFDLIMNQARKILDERPELMVKEIASILGYDDQCYFSRAFKKLTGASPLEYRERVDGKYPGMDPDDPSCP